MTALRLEEDRIDELIRRSSLGTEGVERLRSRDDPAAQPRACGGAAVVPQPSPVAPAVEFTEHTEVPDLTAAINLITAPRPRPAPPQDAPLIERLVADAVAGSNDARDQLLAEIHPLVLRYCRGRLGRTETAIGSADDVAQEVCLAVVGALPSYQIKGLSFRAFVYGIAAHKVTEAFRAIGRNRSEPMAELPDTAVASDEPEQRLLAGELAERINGMLHVLTPRQREVLILRIVGGIPAEDVARIIGSSPGAVRVTQHRALSRLRAAMSGSLDPNNNVDDQP
jgi:RNA polymerase sigma-70 factor, ECF subfamily